MGKKEQKWDSSRNLIMVSTFAYLAGSSLSNLYPANPFFKAASVAGAAAVVLAVVDHLYEIGE